MGEDGKKIGGREGPINDEEMFLWFDTYIVERSWICGDSLSTQCSYLASISEKQHKLYQVNHKKHQHYSFDGEDLGVHRMSTSSIDCHWKHLRRDDERRGGVPQR